MRRLSLLERTKSKRPPPLFAETFLQGGRWRMIFLLIGLFLAFQLYDITRKPESWNWFERMTTDGEEINTKLPPTVAIAEVVDGVVAHPDRPIITHYTAAETPTEATEAPPEKLDQFTRVWRESWADIFQHLHFAERSLFYRGLKSVRDERPLAEEYHKPFAELQQKLDDAWTRYRVEAITALKDLGDEEKAVWVELLNQTGGKWSRELYPAFEKVAQGTALSAAEKQAMEELQTLLDAILLARVQDDSVWRAEEAEISFRLFEQALRMKQPAAEKVTQATFLQLFKQSAVYRGKTVHVRGQAKQAWHVKAPSNWVGIEGYYVFVLRPNDVNAPIVVYSLELPPGFPKVKDKDIDAAVTNLDETMEFTGIFLKRWAYTGRDGTYTAPLIIARRGDWTPPPRSLGEPMTPAEIQQNLQLVGGMIATMGFLVLVGWYFWPRAPRRELPSVDDLQTELKSLANQPTTSVSEELLRLESQARSRQE